MLELHDKRNVWRIINNKAVKLKQSPIEVLEAPVGVRMDSLVDCTADVVRVLYNRVVDLEDMLRRMVQSAEEANIKADAIMQKAKEDGSKI